MGASKLEKQKQKLIELGVMEQEDTLVDFLQASYVERLVGKLGKWKQGWTGRRKRCREKWRACYGKPGYRNYRNAGRQYCYSLQDDPGTGQMFPEPDADWHYDPT